jgi:hypothetical protein
LPDFFLIYFLTTNGPAHYTYNIQLTKNNFNELFLFQNSPVQPLPVAVEPGNTRDSNSNTNGGVTDHASSSRRFLSALISSSSATDDWEATALLVLRYHGPGDDGSFDPSALNVLGMNALQSKLPRQNTEAPTKPPIPRHQPLSHSAEPHRSCARQRESTTMHPDVISQTNKINKGNKRNLAESKTDLVGML